MNTNKVSILFLILVPVLLSAQQPPNVLSIFPSSQMINADKNTDITILFDAALDPQSVNATTVKIFGRWSGPMPGNLYWKMETLKFDLPPRRISSPGNG